MARGQDDRRDARRGRARPRRSSSSSSRSTRAAAVSATRRSFRGRASCCSCCASTRAPATTPRARWWCRRCGRWRSAACAITSAAASIAIRSTATGACRTSRRCSTTRRRSCWRVSRRRRRGDDPFFAQIAEDTLQYVARDMTDARGGFYSAEDADSVPRRAKTSKTPELRTRRTRQPTRWKARSTSGPPTKFAPLLGDDSAIFERPLRRPAEWQCAVRSAARVRQQEPAVHRAIDCRPGASGASKHADRRRRSRCCARARSCSMRASSGRARSSTTRC